MKTQRSREPEALRDQVREGYTRIVRESPDAARADAAARSMGYSHDQLEQLPEGANLGVGCGNPTAIDALRTGETVVDLGSGAGMDVFLAARQVGPSGHVIGIDMTDAMLDKARENAKKVGLEDTVEFRKGQIENLPIEDESVDAIISNCVVNLSPEKDRVYAEAYRVLKPGGRLMISDIVLERPLPQAVIDSIDAYLGCVGGASLRAEYLDTIAKAGFREVRIDREASFLGTISFDDPRVQQAMERMQISTEEAEGFASDITSLHIYAEK